ncbi:MAG: aminopeptidase [Firmicutes bacterium]|jgi:aminopeptidase|nr:aminopeptidase [Bacillota bacterium]
MKKTVMRSYAKLIVRVGANVQKGQEVRVFASLDQPEFIKMLAEECYKAGASRVTVDWNYPELTKLSARYMKLRDLSETREWEKARMQDMVDHLPVRIFIESEDPDGLRGINPKYFKAFAARIKISKPYRDAIDNKHQWCIAAVPGEAWAKKVHPELSKRAAVEQLWKDILYTARADGEDPIADWEEHNRDLKARSKYLNDLHLRELRYHSANGTDFKVGLIPTAEFHAGRDTTMQGVVYDPNMPTEEVFTSPDRRTAEGIVYATKPLSYQGQLIENFSVRFEKGRAVEVKAEKGQDVLEQIISMDEGCHYLGECALVPKESPIHQSGLLFYNTLFDENAACHLALGFGFDECVKGFENMTKEELYEIGVNDAGNHTDFMIGSDDLSIDGVDEHGNVHPIFRNGTWAF